MLPKMIVSIAFYLFYWFCCFLGTGSDKKNLLGLRSYPDAVQQAARNHPVLGEKAPQEKSLFAILLGNLVLFTVVFSVLGMALKNVLELHDFGTAFWFFLALGEGLDCLILSSLTCCGGGTRSAFASLSCRRNPTIKTQASTLALSCGASPCLHWWLYLVLESWCWSDDYLQRHWHFPTAGLATDTEATGHRTGHVPAVGREQLLSGLGCRRGRAGGSLPSSLPCRGKK